ncbi:hypothetical protein FVE85_7570 [Porphyridium purpureum]|uniref:Uncharacterized protein n=1 Tax=Porphyridium purpureum TaxID=35688 RepID=A0A5J4Z9H8_PORPP|nr:hypothetical protein FVE85_7570 [Porphyridium purpureum]|eukprot:POR9315..scf295_1
MLWKRKRRDDELRLEEVEAELRNVEERVSGAQRDRGVVQRRKSYAQQSVLLLGILLFPLVFLAMFAWDTLHMVWRRTVGLGLSGGSIDDHYQLSPILRIIVMGCVVVLVACMNAMAALWYNRQLAGCDARIEEARAKKKALVDMLKKRSMYTETTRLLQQYDRAPGGENIGANSAGQQRRQVSGSKGAVARDSSNRSAGEARPLPSGSMGSLDRGTIVGSADSARNDFPAEEYVTPGGMLLNRFVDLLAGDEPEVEAATASKMRRLENELEEERKKRAALELRLAELKQRLGTSPRDPFFSTTSRAREGSLRVSVPPFPNLSDSEKSVATPATPFDADVSAILPSPVVHGAGSPQEADSPIGRTDDTHPTAHSSQPSVSSSAAKSPVVA